MGLVHQSAELGTIRGAGTAVSLLTVSTFSNRLLKEIHAASPQTPWFYQFSVDENEELNAFLLHEAVANGAKAIVVGVFDASFGRRER